MEAVKAVPNEGEDRKSGKPRDTSGVSFPYFDLDSVVEVARVIHEAGGLTHLDQLAALLGYSSIANGSFRMRVSAAKKFGVIDGTNKSGLRATSRGLAIVAPENDGTATRARVEAFMAIELFKQVYDRYNGTSLPGEAGLKNLLETTMGVVKDRVTPTVRVMLDSAEQAGLFRTTGNRTRMVVPTNVGALSSTNLARPPAQPKPATPPTDEGQGARNGGSGGGGGGGNWDIDPALIGLLRRLPPVGERLSKPRRDALIDAFKATINFIYPEDESE